MELSLLLFLSPLLFPVFASLLSASALVSQADSLTDSSCHSDTSFSAHDAAAAAAAAPAEAQNANPAGPCSERHPVLSVVLWTLYPCVRKRAFGATVCGKTVTLKLLFCDFNA